MARRNKKTTKNNELGAEQNVQHIEIDLKMVGFGANILKATSKFLIFTFIIFGVIIYSDHVGYFNSEKHLDHISKRWDAFYDFTETNEVDVLLIGNSHMFANINPKNMSATLGANVITVGGPGSTAHDIYFSLKEALTRCKPKLVVYETFGINNISQHKVRSHLVTSQLNSFTGRKDFWLKLIATPILFSPNQYGYAWSKTIRNHNYLFKNQKQIKANIELSKQPKVNRPQPLHLGQLIYYTRGMEDSTIKKFEFVDPPVNGNEYYYSDYAEKYVDKTVELCRENNIEIIFFTTPMYKKNIANYDAWKNKLSELLDKYNTKWLDLQSPYLEEEFTPDVFQNSYKHNNQHLTHLGALLASYKLSNFIKEELEIELMDRSKDRNWHRIFYAQDGYFENFSPVPNDKRNRIVQSAAIKNGVIREALFLQNQGNGNSKFLVKVDRNSLKDRSILNSRLALIVKFSENKVIKESTIVIPYDKFYTPLDNAIYSIVLRPGIQIIEVKGGEVQI